MIDLLSEIFNDMKHRAVSLRQLSFLSNVLLCLDDGKLPLGNKIYIVDNSEDDRTSPGIGLDLQHTVRQDSRNSFCAACAATREWRQPNGADVQ